jgi:hypothetical protein
MAHIVEKEAVTKRFERTGRYLDGAIGFGVDRLLRPSLLACLTKRILKHAKAKALARTASRPSTRYDVNFFKRESVRRRFYRYYASCLREIAKIKSESDIALEPPNRIIFGHTHQPISIADEHLTVPCAEGASARSVMLHNTGGWLCTDGVFCGAEVFVYESEKGFSSRSVASRDGTTFTVSEEAQRGSAYKPAKGE